MPHRNSAIGFALTSTALLVGTMVAAAPASAAVPVPSGCSFDKTTGRTTCTSTATAAPVSYAAGQTILSGPAGDGSPADLLCGKYGNPGYVSHYMSPGSVILGQTTTTTTTAFQGASAGNGNKPVTSVTHSTTLYALHLGDVVCLLPNNAGGSGVSNSLPGEPPKFTVTVTNY